MKKALGIIKNIFISAAIVNLAANIAIIAVFLSVDTLEINAVMQLELLIAAVVFAAICGIGLSVFKAIKNLIAPLRWCLEYAVCLFGLYISVFCMTGHDKNFTAFFAVATAFTVIYVVVALVAVLFKKLFCGKRSDDAEYENVFEELKK